MASEKKKFNAGDTVRISQISKIFEKENYLGPTELIKCQKS